MNRLPNRSPALVSTRAQGLRSDVTARNPRIALRTGLLTAAALALMALAAKPAHSVENGVEFGTPTVLSQQGQRLKVLVPVRSAPDDRATAASFLVRETEVPQGHAPLAAQTFTVMRPARSDYVVLQSADVVRAPQVALLVSVAGDPKSPYRVDLQVPAASASGDQVALAGEAANRARKAGAHVQTRRLRGPAGDSTLPPK